MAWPAIGSESMITLRGRVQPLGDVMEEITRPGEDGHEYRLVGARGAPTELRTESDYETAADAKAAETAYLAMKGTLQTITYGDGQTRANVMILDVQIESVFRVETPVGGVETGSGNYLLAAMWQVQATE